MYEIDREKQFGLISIGSNYIFYW